ncbi:hypothetical protein D9613_012584 [Agrocybe pediades]|uniref:Uncharacterized protein n=1 Tax=Agrocybe pediades TaxID=84607 RepID=A0A8H4R4I5_9AGAR|nr:hypothetical protein D9613_012584 [Agrocybe pediades]
MKSIHSSVFPQELFDYVIDEVAKSADSHSCQEESRAQRLAALALVCIMILPYAGPQTFIREKVRLANMDKDIQRPRVRLLVELLKANGRLASYITSLTLIMHPSDSDVQRDTAYILRALFNDKDNSAPCSLAVKLKGRLEKDTEQALFEICHKPRLASLHLADYPFPCNFLKYTFIKPLLSPLYCYQRNMNLLSSVFPQELYDGVIDEIGKSIDTQDVQVSTRASQLGTLALVSRSF